MQRSWNGRRTYFSSIIQAHDEELEFFCARQLRKDKLIEAQLRGGTSLSSLSLTWAGAFELVAELSISYKAQLVLTVIHKACYQPEFFVHDKNLCKSSVEPEDFGPGMTRAFEAEPGLVAPTVLSRRGGGGG